MAKEQDDRSRVSGRAAQHHHDERREEFFDDPAEHLEIETRRFQGGLLPTPELYALAREQWYRLPGSVVRPSMDPSITDTAAGQEAPDSPDDKQDGGTAQ
jgi:hypothetical protein